MTKIIYLGGNRGTDKYLTIGKVYEKIDLDYSGNVRVHDDVWDIHSITNNAYREVIEQPVSIGDTVAVTSECANKDLVGKIGKVIEAIDDFGIMYFKVQFENQINTKEWGEVKNIVLRDNRLVLIEQDSKPERIHYEPALTDEAITELADKINFIKRLKSELNILETRKEDLEETLAETEEALKTMKDDLGVE